MLRSFTAGTEMILPIRAVVICLTMLVFAMPAAFAEDRWVTDEFEVMMRSGKSTKQSIVRQLKSGTRVEVLSIDKEAGYTQVKVASGAEGWVLSRYLR